MKRDTPIAFRTTEKVRKQVKILAKSKGQTVSQFLGDLIEEIHPIQQTDDTLEQD